MDRWDGTRIDMGHMEDCHKDTTGKGPSGNNIALYSNISIWSSAVIFRIS
ncbi:hypothetical protein HYC85_029406 [Camellia sinensis]|uniref:Uncharacterized protein n=1 Tax=Camellia sinensis TaxID=4442 RepID=A0A7J7FY67_CAMSI|nr:hypothetical protein HYC85_029406 [Camellia sinensis]